ncbi:MAG: endonuclease [Flavobacteriaceae bacterium]|nr:endonuclease [Flavobacteriaceae bacterium]
MEKFVTYLLYSKKSSKIYIGYTSNLIQRFYSPNYFSKRGYTVRYRPWVVLEVEFHHTKKEAILREKFLKFGKGRAYIRNTIITKYNSIGFISA